MKLSCQQCGGGSCFSDSCIGDWWNGRLMLIWVNGVPYRQTLTTYKIVKISCQKFLIDVIKY